MCLKIIIITIIILCTFSGPDGELCNCRGAVIHKRRM